jgi:hypothetical protein
MRLRIVRFLCYCSSFLSGARTEEMSLRMGHRDFPRLLLISGQNLGREGLFFFHLRCVERDRSCPACSVALVELVERQTAPSLFPRGAAPDNTHARALALVVCTLRASWEGHDHTSPDGRGRRGVPFRCWCEWRVEGVRPTSAACGRVVASCGPRRRLFHPQSLPAQRHHRTHDKRTQHPHDTTRHDTTRHDTHAHTTRHVNQTLT